MKIDEPAVAVAVSLCWLARWKKPTGFVLDVTERHPRKCAWCDYPTDYLMDALRTWDPNSGRARAFGKLASAAQRKLVSEAQAFVAEEVPA